MRAKHREAALCKQAVQRLCPRVGEIRVENGREFMELRYPGGERYLKLGEAHGDLEPLALTRPVFDLLCGLSPLSAKQSRYFGPCTVGELVHSTRKEWPMSRALRLATLASLGGAIYATSALAASGPAQRVASTLEPRGRRADIAPQRMPSSRAAPPVPRKNGD